MAVFTGTAAGNHDLLIKIVGHLTDAGVMGAEVWQLLADSSPSAVAGEFYLKAPGLAGTDEIYMSLYSFESPGSDVYNMGVRGATAYDPAFNGGNQPGSSPFKYLTLWQNAIPYTLVANGRRFILIAKVSTIFANMYCGHILPYATEDEYPYPLYIAGNAHTNYRWSQTGYWVGSPWDPSGASSGYNGASAACLRHYDGQWVNFQNYYDSSGNRTNSVSLTAKVWPWHFFDFAHGRGFDGGYALHQGILSDSANGGNVYGELQGVYFVSGFGNASENTIVVDGKTYLVTQNTWRTGRSEYAAILLE